MSDEKGYIKLYRSITDNFLWEDRATKLQAWLDLLMMVNYRDKETYFENRLVEVKRGEIITSERKLAARWKWDKRTVKTYLETLQKKDMITFVSVPGICTTISVVNYCKYQGFSENDVPPIVPPIVPPTAPPDVPPDVPPIVPNIKKDNKGEESKEGKRNNTPLISPQGDSAKPLTRKDIQDEINKLIDDSELSQEVRNKLKEFVEYRRKLKCKFFTSPKYFKNGTLKDAIKAEKEYGSYATIQCIDNTFAQGYQGVFFDKAWKYAKEVKQTGFTLDDILQELNKKEGE